MVPLDGPYSRRPSFGRRLLAGAVALVLFGAALAGLGYYLSLADLASGPDFSAFWRLLGVRTASPAPAEGTRTQASEAEVLLPENPGDGPTAVIAPGAVIVRTYVYEKCGCEDVFEGEAEPGLVGLDRRSLAAELRGDWEITAFSPDRVELRHVDREQMCPDHAGRCTVRFEDGRLVLYAGDVTDPAKGLVFLKVLKVMSEEELLAAVGAEFAAALKEGFVFSSEEEVHRELEGLSD
jgi:hypothetical protein